MGDVLTGKYHFSLNTWVWFTKRDPLFDFVPVSKEKFILTYIPKPPEVDYGLYIRPFRVEAWKAIFAVIFVGFLSFALTQFTAKSYGIIISSRIVMFFGWSFFLLINAYYGGALTMFFVSEIALPFETMRDVLKATPFWTLLFFDGNQVVFETPASQVKL
jgi:hypothetical protein